MRHPFSSVFREQRKNLAAASAELLAKIEELQAAHQKWTNLLGLVQANGADVELGETAMDQYETAGNQMDELDLALGMTAHAVKRLPNK